MLQNLPDSGDFWSESPPLSNTGVFEPKGDEPKAAWGRLDYLKLTVWAEHETVMGRVEEGLIDGHLADQFTVWQAREVGGRTECIFEACPGLAVVKYKGADYCTVEVKGEVCSVVDGEALRGLSRTLYALGRVRASRVDVAWDGVPFTVAQVVSLLRLKGTFRSRARFEGVDAVEKPTGSTVYLPERYRHPWFARVYDKRGPVRFEQQFTKEMAAGVWIELAHRESSEWPAACISMVRECFDLVESSDRPSRAALWAPWAEFVGSAGRQRVVRLPPAETEITAWGRAEAAIARCARMTEAIARAFGEDWLVKRRQAEAAKRWTADDDRFVRELQRYCFQATGRRPDDVPI